MSLDCLGSVLIGAEAPSLDDVRLGKGALKKGMRGDAVSSIQRLVGLTGGDVDGDFGGKTETAVSAFQRAKGLKVDGEVGRETISALDEMLMSGESFKPANAASSKPASAPASVVNKGPGSVLRLGPADEEPSKMGTYAAYGLGGLATIGLAYVAFGR